MKQKGHHGTFQIVRKIVPKTAHGGIRTINLCIQNLLLDALGPEAKKFIHKVCPRSGL